MQKEVAGEVRDAISKIFTYDYNEAQKGDKGFCWRLQRKPVK
jgi:hypothetical protein